MPLIIVSSWALTGCFSTVFSRLPPGALLPAQDQAERILTTTVRACELDLPPGTVVRFEQNFRGEALIDEKPWSAVVSAPVTLGDHRFGAGTRFTFDYGAKKLMTPEYCNIVAIELTEAQTFGPNTFGPGDNIQNFVNAMPTQVFLGASRAVGGERRAEGDRLTLDPTGRVLAVRSRAERNAEAARANAYQQRQDEHHRQCNTTCAPLSGAARGDCINNCLFH